jgi:hypothetical protein
MGGGLAIGQPLEATRARTSKLNGGRYALPDDCGGGQGAEASIEREL